MLDETVLARTFVELSTALADRVNVRDWLHDVLEHGVHLLHVDAGAAMITEDNGGLTLVTATSTLGEMLASLQLKTGEGPCFDSVRLRSAVMCVDLDESGEEWPRFTQRATEAGIHGVHAFPLVREDKVIGTLNFFRARPPRPLAEDEVKAAHALSHLTAVGFSHTRDTNASGPKCLGQR